MMTSALKPAGTLTAAPGGEWLGLGGLEGAGYFMPLYIAAYILQIKHMFRHVCGLTFKKETKFSHFVIGNIKSIRHSLIKAQHRCLSKMIHEMI